MRMEPSIKHTPYSPACGLLATENLFDGVLVKYKKSAWLFSSVYFRSKFSIWAMLSKVLPGVVSLASFFCDPRTSSLSGNTRNFMKVNWLMAWRWKKYATRNQKSCCKTRQWECIFLVFNYIGKKGTSKSQSSKQCPVYSEQKDGCFLNQQSLRNPFGNFSKQHFLMEK